MTRPEEYRTKVLFKGTMLPECLILWYANIARILDLDKEDG